MAQRLSPKAKKALLLSINKWSKIVEGTSVDRGSANCALCKAFPAEDCRGCPVRKATGHEGCRGTPYGDFKFEASLIPNTHGDLRADTEGAIINAARMVAFLRGLLPARR